jgi:hypothetical protein
MSLALVLITFLSTQTAYGQVLDLDNFESYPEGGVPSRWQTNHDRTLIPITPDVMRDVESFIIFEEGSNKFVRATTIDQAFRLILTNANQFDWNLMEYPRIAWDWRAIYLPQNAREDDDRTNDTGGAVYVTFSNDFIGRPVSIKYTYSSTLPVGSTASYGPLKVIVVASALDDIGEWKHVERDLIADYQLLFGKTPPHRPLAIMLWSDSDTMNDHAIIDFDNVMLLGQIGEE